MANKTSEKKNKRLLFSIVLAVILIAMLLVSLLFADKINSALGLTKETEETTDTVVDVGSEKGNDLNVHFVDVGQGDACIIELPDGKKMLIDAADTHSENKKKLLDYIDKYIYDGSGKTITYFDYVILTHSDSDHCGGMADVLSKYPAKKFYRPNVYAEYKNPDADFPVDPAMREIKDSVDESKLDWVKKDTKAYYDAICAGYNTTEINNVKSEVFVTDPTNTNLDIVPDLPKTDPNYYAFTFYGPQEKAYKDWNDYSPIMILEYHGKRFMLSGDCEKEGEAGFVAKATAKNKEDKYKIFDDSFTVDVFKLGHHGSRTSSSEDFINVMTTEANCKNVVAVISCGEGNSYGHPHAETMTKLNKLGFSESNIVRTDVMGSISMAVRGDVTESGEVEYTLYVGTETVSRTEVSEEEAPLSWKEIVYTAIVVIVLVLIIYPIVDTVRKNNKKQGGGKSNTQRKSTNTRSKTAGTQSKVKR